MILVAHFYRSIIARDFVVLNNHKPKVRKGYGADYRVWRPNVPELALL
jgi:hypothetical protein